MSNSLTPSKSGVGEPISPYKISANIKQKKRQSSSVNDIDQRYHSHI